MDYKKLVELAYSGMEKAYAPYSNFTVGAALLTNDDKVFTGCNVECASYGGTNCAERTAIFKAVSEGYREFKAIAIVSNTKDLTFPCGICRQVINEFCVDIDIVLDGKDGYKVFTLKELLPYAFNKSELDK